VAIVEDLLWGVDVDPEAVAVTRAALGAWVGERGDRAAAGHVVRGDALARGRGVWPDAPAAGFDLVVGNPPFLSQLSRHTTRDRAQARRLAARLGGSVRPYADAAALFLADGASWLAPGGRLALILPESVLAARDAGAARATALSQTAVIAFWWPGEAVFDAVVDVCAPVLERGAPARPVRRFHGPGFDPVAPAAAAAISSASWSALLDQAPPRVAGAAARVQARRRSGRGLGTRVEATAGFRDQFYGVVPYVHESDDPTADPTGDPAGDEPVEASRGRARLMTVGLIDPLHDRWGAAATRFAGRRWSAPVVDLAGLGRGDPRLARWAEARLVPKVVLATQTRVLEPAVDTTGTWWPSVPVIAVTPRSGDGDELWSIAAVLAAPAVSAWALAQYRGAALSRDAIKLSATQILDIPLPVDAGAWAEGAVLAAAAHRRAQAGDPAGWHEALLGLGGAMAAAYRSGPEVVDWWSGRLVAWR
jgi:hypothetical protein